MLDLKINHLQLLAIRVWRGLTPTDTTTMMLPVVRELLDQMERLEYQ